MAVTRKFLKGLDLSDEQIDTIIEQHTETVDGLKEQINEYKESYDKLPKVQKELDAANAELESARKSSWKVKYDALKEEYDTYKTEQTNKETKAAKEKAYRALLKEAGVSEKRISAVMKVSDDVISKMDLDDEGNAKNVETLTKGIKDEWSDFIVKEEPKGANTATPPANTGGNEMTKESIMKIQNHDERLRAIAEHKDLFKGGN